MSAFTHKPFFWFICFIFTFNVTAVHSQNDTAKVNLISADILEYNNAINPDYQLLKGNVVFEYDGSLLYCNYAKIYIRKDYVVAKENVHIIINDTTHMYSDSLIIDGDTELAEMMGNVKLIDNEVTLTTDHLYYDLKRDVAYYLTGGEITDPENYLTSKNGYYYQKSKDFYFSDSVYIKNKDTEMFSDTLMYNTKSGITHFYGKSKIVQPENTMFCERGTYDSNEEIGKFNKNVELYSGSRILKSDSLYYNGTLSYSEAFGNVFFQDTTDNILLNSHFGRFFEKDSAFFACDSALLRIVEKEDTLHLHADSLFMMNDTVLHMQKVLFAYNKARIWRYDFQAVSDSIVFLTKDSVMYLYSSPIMWLDNTQLIADTIYMTYLNGQTDRLFMRQHSFIVSKEKTGDFQQIRSINMEGIFADNALDMLWANDSAETIYYVFDDDMLLIGINKTISERVKINFTENNVNYIVFYNTPTGTLKPEDQISEEEKYLSDFRWEESVRPKYPADVFRDPLLEPEARELPKAIPDSVIHNDSLIHIPDTLNNMPVQGEQDQENKVKNRYTIETDNEQQSDTKGRENIKPDQKEEAPALRENETNDVSKEKCFIKRWIRQCREKRNQKKLVFLHSHSFKNK